LHQRGFWTMQITGFNIRHLAGDVAYGILESEEGVDELNIDVGIGGAEGFSYFHKQFGMPYPFFLKKSIESGHVLAVAVLVPDKLLAFARFEKLEDRVERIYKGRNRVIKHPLYLLRSIEVHSSYRHTGIGRVLFAIAVRQLRANVLTMPDNANAARFFKEKLLFGEIETASGIDPTRYPGYLMLPYPKAVDLLNVLVQRYPRMVLPELIDLYETLQFKANMGKTISPEEIGEFEVQLERFRSMIDEKTLAGMNDFLSNIREAQ